MVNMSDVKHKAEPEQAGTGSGEQTNKQDDVSVSAPSNDTKTVDSQKNEGEAVSEPENISAQDFVELDATDTQGLSQDATDITENPDAISDTQRLIEENQRLADELLRTRAEMENSRKRLQRFFEDKVHEKNKSLLLDIVELLDNFDRALNMGEQDLEKQSEKKHDAIVEGIKMIEEQFLKTLETNWKFSRYDSCNAEFDPVLHEAMIKEDSDTVGKETVVEEFMKGYMYDQKVLRPAKVKVAIPK